MLQEVAAAATGRTQAYTRTKHVGETEKWCRAAAQYTGAECLLWPFKRVYPNGYGAYNTRQLATTAHRFVCRLAHGEPPQPKLQAAHSCGNRLCCNPRHLRWATCRENLADRKAHGTLRAGDSHHNTVYSDATLSELTLRYWTFVEQAASDLGLPKNFAHRFLRGAARTTKETLTHGTQ